MFRGFFFLTSRKYKQFPSRRQMTSNTRNVTTLALESVRMNFFMSMFPFTICKKSCPPECHWQSWKYIYIFIQSQQSCDHWVHEVSNIPLDLFLFLSFLLNKCSIRVLEFPSTCWNLQCEHTTHAIHVTK